MTKTYRQTHYENLQSKEQEISEKLRKDGAQAVNVGIGGTALVMLVWLVARPWEGSDMSLTGLVVISGWPLLTWLFHHFNTKADRERKSRILLEYIEEKKEAREAGEEWAQS